MLTRKALALRPGAVRCLSHARRPLPVDPRVAEAEIQAEQVADAAWAKSPAALELLRAGQTPPTDYLSFRSFDDHLAKRGFSAALDPAHASAKRTLSSVMTFPLTLGYACNHIYRDFPRLETKVLVLGARAESNLPPVWWKEYLYINDRAASTVLRMTGPGLLPPKAAEAGTPAAAPAAAAGAAAAAAAAAAPARTLLRWPSFAPKNSPDMNEILDDIRAGQPDRAVPTLTLERQERTTMEAVKLFHDRKDVTQMLQWADLFVLFNPGVGSPHCGQQWEATIRLLIQTRKPLLFTAFNAPDLDRDLTALDRISSEEDSQDMGEPLEFIITPHENPFKSLKRTIDDSAAEGTEGRIVSANMFVYALQSK